MSRVRAILLLAVFAFAVIARVFAPSSQANPFAHLGEKSSVTTHSIEASSVSADEDAGSIKSMKWKRHGQNISAPPLMLTECGFAYFDVPQAIHPSSHARAGELRLAPETPPPISLS